MSSDLMLGIVVGIAVGLFIYFFQKKRGSTDFIQIIEQKLADILPKHMQDAREQLVLLAKEKLGAEKQDIRTALEKMIEQVQLELKDSGRTSQSLLQQIKDHEKITKELSVTAEGLKKVLTNNQLRGQFGEQVAEDLLKMAGFVRGVDFEFNKSQDIVSSRPDFSIYLPDKTKMNVDVKFPYSNLQRAAETDDRPAKQQLMKQFAQDVRKKITQITGREYINPDDRTVDFVILFVPNEMIFSYIYDKLHEVWQEAMRKKVVLAGPFSFTALLRMVRQAYDNFRYQKNIHQIIAHVKNFEVEFGKYNEEFDKIGEYIKRLTDQYQRVETTRTRQLTRVVEKIKLGEGDSLNKPLPE